MANKNVKSDKRKGWHFVAENMKLGYGDNRKVEVGKTLSMNDSRKPDPCTIGMHASDRPSQAARFNRGPVLCRVEVWGDVAAENDKFCGRHRKVVEMRKITHEDVKRIAKKIGCSVPHSKESIAANLNYLSNSDAKKFDQEIEKIFSSGEPVAREKPELTEKAVLECLMPRVIRTRAEILRDLGDYYKLEDDVWGDDLFEDIVEASDKIIRIEDFHRTRDGNYYDGFVLRGIGR